MNPLKLITGAALALALSTPGAYAAFGCRDLPTIVTPDNAPVNHSKVVASGASALNGTAYTKATFCPKAITRPGLCTGESISPPADSGVVTFTTLDGDVPDIYSHRNGIVIPPTKWTPEIFIPTTGPLPGSC